MARLVIVDMVTAEIEAAGIDHEVEHGGKHPKVRFYVGRQRYTYVCPATASDHRAAMNCRAGIRRLLRKILAESDLLSARQRGKQRARKGDNQ